MARFQCVSSAGEDDCDCYETRMGDAEVRVVITGTGRFAARRAMQGALKETPDFCIASGFAGALRPEYAPGDVLVAKQVTEIEGGRSLPSDGELMRLAAQVGAKPVDTFVVSDKIVATSAEKRQLAALGDAVEMEGACVVGAAWQNRVRSVAIRCVSDTVDRDLPLDFERVFDENGRVSVLRVVGQLARKPTGIIGLLRLARDSEQAADALARVLHALVQAVGESPWETAKADAIAAR